jgi:hypothetical protein
MLASLIVCLHDRRLTNASRIVVAMRLGVYIGHVFTLGPRPHFFGLLL